MGKSSGGSAPAGSQTIIQDIAEPFKGFAVRSLQRAEDLQGLPAVPFTGIATAPPSPDELVGAQALRDRFMEHGPLSAEALALQRTAADPITAASIQARQSPFEALIAQEAYRRQDERTQRALQNQRAREVASGGFDRGRGAIEDHLIKQRAADQERQIGLEAGQRAFTNAAQLAQADRSARGKASEGLLAALANRQALGRRDIDDLIKVGAQFREQFVQPELNLEREQFGDFRGPGSVMNPFGFEQFFSGIRSAAPTPGITSTQQFKQTPSGLGQIAPAIGGGLAAANQAGLFKQSAEGGIVDFHAGGLAAHSSFNSQQNFQPVGVSGQQFTGSSPILRQDLQEQVIPPIVPPAVPPVIPHQPTPIQPAPQDTAAKNITPAVAQTPGVATGGVATTSAPAPATAPAAAPVAQPPAPVVPETPPSQPAPPVETPQALTIMSKDRQAVDRFGVSPHDRRTMSPERWEEYRDKALYEWADARASDPRRNDPKYAALVESGAIKNPGPPRWMLESSFPEIKPTPPGYIPPRGDASWHGVQPDRFGGPGKLSGQPVPPPPIEQHSFPHSAANTNWGNALGLGQPNTQLPPLMQQLGLAMANQSMGNPRNLPHIQQIRRRAEGGIVGLHEGGLAAHEKAGHSHPELDPGVITQVIQVLQEQGHLVPGDHGRMEFMLRMQGDPDFKALYEQALAGVVEGSGWVDPIQGSETVVEEAGVEPNFIPPDQKARLEAGDNLEFHQDVETLRDTLPGQARIRNKFTAPYMAQSLANLGEGEDFAASVSSPDMDEGWDVGMIDIQKAPEEYWAETAEYLPPPAPPTPSARDFDEGFATGMNRIPEVVEGRAVWDQQPKRVPDRAPSPLQSISPREYSDADITAMLEFANIGRGRERLPEGLRSLDQQEMREHLKPMRKQWRENSKERREKERRERINNRRSFNRNSSAPKDTGSFDFDFSDIKEFFGFKEGGIASFANGKSVYSDAETTFTGKDRERKGLENKQVIEGMMEEAELDPENLQDVAEFIRKGFGRYALTPGYPGRSEELTKAEKRHKTRRGLKDAQNARSTEDVGNVDPDKKSNPAYINKLMDMYTAFLNEKRTPGYPDRPPLSESQRRSAIISAIAGALQGIRNDRDTGRADFSGMGEGASSAVSNYMNELETRRKEEIAAREAKGKTILEGIKTTYEMHQALSGAEKDRADAAVAWAEAEFPNLPIYKIIAPTLLKGLVDQMIDESQFEAAVREAVKAFTGKTGTEPGLMLSNFEQIVEGAKETQ